MSRLGWYLLHYWNILMLGSEEFPPKKQSLQQSKGGAEGRNSVDSIGILQESLKNSDEPM